MIFPPYKCTWCSDRGWYSYFKGGSKNSLGEVFTFQCQHCTGQKKTDTRGLDKDLKSALAWFQSSEIPTAPFRLSKWKYIDDPAKYWADLKAEIALDNIYRLEYIRDDLIALQALFWGEEM